MDKQALVWQLAENLRGIAREAHAASAAAAQEAAHGASPSERRDDARVALEYGGLARGQKQRAERAFAQLATIEGLRPEVFRPSQRIDVGAVVEIEDEDSGEGRTFFLAPVGAGVTLTGPDGDGYLTVVTPSSPIGKAVMGRKKGDVIDVTVAGDVREWRIVWVE